MGIPIFGINIPSPKIKIKPLNLEKYADLYRGIRDTRDMVSWRTLIISIRELLGITKPDFTRVPKRSYLKARKLIKSLAAKTYLESLTAEIEYAVGINSHTAKSGKDLDVLIFSGRHYPEPILWKLADYAKSKGKNVAIINPVGHYNDGQTRVVGPSRYFRNVKKLVIISSTQFKLGGSITVLSNVIRLLRNIELAKRVECVDIVIPMFGGSRGHRLGQSEEVGFEVMEASFNAKVLSLLTKDILNHLSEDIPKLPKIRFSSIDIHNSEFPAKTFADEGLDFISISSSAGIARGIIELLPHKPPGGIKLVACDGGAIKRTEDLATELLNIDSSFLTSLQIIYVEKKRLTAGIVASAEIANISEWKKVGKIIVRKIVPIPKKPIFKNTAVIYSDDMIDTGGTAERDLKFIASVFPNTSLKIFAATHPVFSKGFSAIKKIGADYYVLGNTLSWEGLEDVRGVEIVDLADCLYSFIQSQ